MRITKYFAACVAVSSLMLSTSAFATYYTGNITMLETWTSGNVAFTINAPGVPCNARWSRICICFESDSCLAY